MDEAALVRLFVELTGEPEAAGKSVLLYLDLLEKDYSPKTGGATDQVDPVPEDGEVSPLGDNAPG